MPHLMSQSSSQVICLHCSPRHSSWMDEKNAIFLPKGQTCHAQILRPAEQDFYHASLLGNNFFFQSGSIFSVGACTIARFVLDPFNANLFEGNSAVCSLRLVTLARASRAPTIMEVCGFGLVQQHL